MGWQTLGKQERKIRVDKKIPIGPCVSLPIYDCFEILKFITGQSIKQLGEDFLLEGMRTKKVLSKIEVHLKHTFEFNNTSYFGNAERGYRSKPTKTVRLQMRLDTFPHDRLLHIAYCLACPKATAAGLILTTSLMNGELLKKIVTRYVGNEMDQDRVKALKRLIKFVNTYNPDEEETSLLLLFAHYVKTGIDYIETRYTSR